MEQGPAEWRGPTQSAKRYHLAFLEASKVSLANLINIAAKEFNKSLFADLSKMSETLHAEHLYVALNRKNPQLTNIVRSLTVFGFEGVLPKDKEKFTTSPDIAMMRVDLSQEEDYVDL